MMEVVYVGCKSQPTVASIKEKNDMTEEYKEIVLDEMVETFVKDEAPDFIKELLRTEFERMLIMLYFD